MSVFVLPKDRLHHASENSAMRKRHIPQGLWSNLKKISRFSKLRDLTSVDLDIEFITEARCECISFRSGRSTASVRKFFSLGMAHNMIRSFRNCSRTKEACSLFILEKGKPVARPGRKAKGRSISSFGSLVAVRVICFGK